MTTEINILDDLLVIDNNINVGIDVDGTLTKEVVGREILELSYSEVEKAMLSCTPQNGVDILLDDKLLDNCHIYIITGRQEAYRCITTEWLNMYGVPYDELIMFPNGFYKSNGYSIPRYIDMKIDIHIQKNIHCSLDDNDRVINALNDHGIYACKVTDNFKDAFKEVLRLKNNIRKI